MHRLICWLIMCVPAIKFDRRGHQWEWDDGDEPFKD